ncbi:alpha/beta hydrolase family protein [Candidatus Sumerlaeota bacterium]|nr:alpha/beta hydrolase family protein [Candidatus Sumerlaeota bacterium]
MWRSLARPLDALPAWWVRWRLFRKRSHLTDRSALEALLDELEGVPPQVLFPTPPALEGSEVIIEPAGELWEGESFVFRMPSTVETDPAGNRVIPGRLLLPRGASPDTPVALLLHPWIGPGTMAMLKRFGRPLLRRGLGAVAIHLPYHLSRTPPGQFSGELSLCGDLVSVINSGRHAVADARRVLGWLRGRGAPRVGALGVSLGGSIAALLASVEPGLRCVACVIPPADATLCMRESVLMRGPIRRDLERSGLDADLEARALRLVSATTHPPSVPADRLLVVGALHDVITPPEAHRRLAEAWGCELWMERHGHISVFLSGRAMARVAGWVADRLGAA